MKKLLLLSFAVIYTLSMNAQKFGVKAGFNKSGYTVNFYTPDGSIMGNGFNAGIFGEMPFSDMISLRGDVTYSQLGSDYNTKKNADWTDETYNYKSMTNISYVNIGVSPVIGFGPAYLFVGPYYGYAISGKQVYKDEYSDETIEHENSKIIFFSEPDAEFDDENTYAGSGDLHKKSDYGINFGVGGRYSSLFVEANVGMGFANFINPESENYFEGYYLTKDDNTQLITGDAQQKNFFFGISVGYIIGGE